MADWLKREGNEDKRPALLSSVEGTPGEARNGHIHIHAMLLSPYVPQPLLSYWWGRALEKESGTRARQIPRVDPQSEKIQAAFTHAPTKRLIEYHRRGSKRPMASIPFPVVHVASAAGDAKREVAKYAVKGLEVDDSSAWVDTWLSLVGTRLYASSRCIAGMLDVQKPMERTHCESCGLVGAWLHRTTKTRGAPQGAGLYECSAIIGMA